MASGVHPAPARQPFTPTIRARREEERIATPNRSVDRALQINKKRSRQVSAAIIVLGVLLLIGLLLFNDRKRERAARSIRVGDDAESVAARMGGEGESCPADDLDHLLNAFPPNTPRPTAEDEIATLRTRTESRWVYGDEGCAVESGDTEVGFGPGGRVVWVVRTHGTTPITM